MSRFWLRFIYALVLSLIGITPAHSQYVNLVGTLSGTNGLTAQNYTLAFTPTQTFYVAGTAIFVGTTSNCATSIDGSVVGVPNPLQSVDISTGFGLGTLPAGNYFIEYTYYTATTETLPSPEMVQQLTSTGHMTISPPTSGVPVGALGMRVYISTVSGQETLQGQTVGNAIYDQRVVLVTGTALPSSNSTVCKQVANDAGWPTGTGYNVAIYDSSGNTVPGYPLRWQLLGPNTTINLTQGLPQYNGNVVYPVPILASPFNHNTQSISGSLNMSGYDILNVGNFNANLYGPIRAPIVNGVVNPTFQGGSDIGAQINSALNSCNFQCLVAVPAGNYNFSTSIVLPLVQYGTYGVSFDPGAVLNYSGTGDEITTTTTAGIAGSAHLIIQGGTHTATSSGTSAVHVYPTNFVTIRDMVIKGFFSGDGIKIEGANQVVIENNEITQNLNGVHLVPTFCQVVSPFACGPGVTGAPFSPNAIRILHNQITGSFHWAIFDETVVTGGGLSPALNNHYEDNNLENNGVSGSAFGAIYEQRSIGTVIGPGNYFEGSPRQVVLGVPSVGSGFESFGSQVTGNFFTTESTTPYNIEAQNTDHLQLAGNSEQVASSISTNCFLNQFSGTSSTNSYFGSNKIDQGVTVAGNTVCTGGTPSLMSGTGSFRIFAPNTLGQLVSGNFITTAATTDTVPSINVIPSSYCFAQPRDATVLGAGWAFGSAWVEPQTGSAIFHHPANANVHVDIWCALEQPSS